MRNTALTIAILATLLLGGQTPSPIQQKNFQHDLAALTKRGFTYRMLDNDLIELTDPTSGEKRIKSLREPSEATIRTWAAQRGIPILEIDPNTIDTSQYTGWFRYWSQVLLSNDSGEPLVVADADRNGMADVYGIYLDHGSNMVTRIYQVDSTGVVLLGHDFSPMVGAAESIIDADRDSLAEFTLSYGGTLFDLEQSTKTSLPNSLQFTHRKNQSFLDPGYTRSYFGNLDKDNILDCLYKGSERDSSDTTTARSRVYIAEYDSLTQNFVRVWSTDFGLNGNVSGIGEFAVNDFDDDGRTEFATALGLGETVYVAENTGDNSFRVTWQDSVPFINLYYSGSGDVDNDGKPEFFVGATMSNGNWTTVFEADSDNRYSAKFIFHLLSAGTFDNPQYLTADVDGDGNLELVVCSGSDIYFFKSNIDNQYYLWYLKRENARDGIQFYDFNKDGKKDFIVSKTIYVDPPGYFRFYADIYVGTSLVTINEPHGNGVPELAKLYPNFPNPFNPTTTISYDLPTGSKVTLKVFDLLGREVATLVDEFKPAGHHQTSFNASKLASGVYLYRLQTGGFTATKKLLLLK